MKKIGLVLLLSAFVLNACNSVEQRDNKITAVLMQTIDTGFASIGIKRQADFKLLAVEPITVAKQAEMLAKDAVFFISSWRYRMNMNSADIVKQQANLQRYSTDSPGPDRDEKVKNTADKIEELKSSMVEAMHYVDMYCKTRDSLLQIAKAGNTNEVFMAKACFTVKMSAFKSQRDTVVYFVSKDWVAVKFYDQVPWTD